MRLGLLIPLISRYATPQFIRTLGTTMPRPDDLEALLENLARQYMDPRAAGMAYLG